MVFFVFIALLHSAMARFGEGHILSGKVGSFLLSDLVCKI